MSKVIPPDRHGSTTSHRDMETAEKQREALRTPAMRVLGNLISASDPVYGHVYITSDLYRCAPEH